MLLAGAKKLLDQSKVFFDVSDKYARLVLRNKPETPITAAPESTDAIDLDHRAAFQSIPDNLNDAADKNILRFDHLDAFLDLPGSRGRCGVISN